MRENKKKKEELPFIIYYYFRVPFIPLPFFHAPFFFTIHLVPHSLLFMSHSLLFMPQPIHFSSCPIHCSLCFIHSSPILSCPFFYAHSFVTIPLSCAPFIPLHVPIFDAPFLCDPFIPLCCTGKTCFKRVKMIAFRPRHLSHFLFSFFISIFLLHPLSFRSL